MNQSLLERLENTEAALRSAAPAPRAHRPELRYLAFYLPQYHPIAENDRWWGEGFTEWTNVRRTRPWFPGHYQPHLPSEELGFYDLRDPDARELQASLATRHAIDGFVYYHYWFSGRRLLEKPFNDVLASGRPSLPFCLCWANENWTRAWDGLERDVLMEQEYSHEDDLAHIRWLAAAFADPRYIRVDGRPLFLVYRTSRLPDPLRTAETWRSEAARLGVGEPYLCRVEPFLSEQGDPGASGFDAAVEFQPDWYRKGPSLPVRTGVHSYPVATELAMSRAPADYKRFSCVTPGWDNSPRRAQQPTVYVGSTPALYERWLQCRSAAFTPFSAEENLFFVNAWNEWGEGNHLEPDRRWGRGFLEAHLRATGRQIRADA